jgi:hypothetical protein
VQNIFVQLVFRSTFIVYLSYQQSVLYHKFLTMKRTKLFWDMEFTGLHQSTTPISLGVVAETGQTFYAEFTDYDSNQVDSWIQVNVIDNLLLTGKMDRTISGWEKWISDKGKYKNAIEMVVADRNMSNFECIGNKEMITHRLTRWLSQFGPVEMWSDCLAYDWVLFCQLFGHAFNVPENVYYIPFDICPKLQEVTGDADISREIFAGHLVKCHEHYATLPGSKHNALWDAYVIRACYNKLYV